MVALSFLGTGKYSKTKYKWQDQMVETPYFQVALKQIFRPEKLVVIQTEEAKAKNGKKLAEHIDFIDCMIPSGRSEEELWQIFDRIVEVVNRGDEVLFDITHGFRSQPLLAIATCNYLRQVYDIRITNLVYGAFEAKNDNNVTPVFDLSPFMDLMMWSDYTRSFLQRGDAINIGKMLSEIHANTYRNNEIYKSRHLTGVGKLLQDFTQALNFIRINELPEVASNLIKKLNHLDEDIAAIDSTHPFKLLLQQIQKQIELFTIKEEQLYQLEGLKYHYNIIDYLFQTDRYVQAITLLRETIISWIRINNDEHPLDREKREQTSQKIYLWSEKANEFEAFKSETGKLYARITDIRNDINHAAFNADPASSSRLQKNIQKLIEDYRTYFNKWINPA